MTYPLLFRVYPLIDRSFLLVKFTADRLLYESELKCAHLLLNQTTNVLPAAFVTRSFELLESTALSISCVSVVVDAEVSRV